MADLFSIKLEKHLIGGLIKNPKMFHEIDTIISEKVFYHDIHRITYSILKQTIENGIDVSPLIIGQKINDLGIKFKDDINIIDYIESISNTTINIKALLEVAKTLDNFRICRDIHSFGSSIVDHVQNLKDKKAEDIINEIDRLYHEAVRVVTFKNQPVPLLTDLEQIILDRANNPVEEMGISTPHPKFNEMYGGIRNGNIYAIVSRPGHGKTTFLNDISFKMVRNNPKCRILILDTEMDTIDIKFRIASSITGIPPWWLETGKWKERADYVQKFNEALPIIRDQNDRIDHLNVAGKPINELQSIIRRWFYRKMQKGDPGMIVYDYLKLTNENGADKKEYQLIGEKVNTLKELSLELQVPIFTACQLNRSGEQGIDDSSAISQSDRLQWFGSFVAIFRRKRPEEIMEHGEIFGTHMMIPLKMRFQGRNAAGHMDFVPVVDEEGRQKLKPNFINYNITTFNVVECGTLRDIVANQELRPVIPQQGEDDAVL